MASLCFIAPDKTMPDVEFSDGLLERIPAVDIQFHALAVRQLLCRTVVSALSCGGHRAIGNKPERLQKSDRVASLN